MTGPRLRGLSRGRVDRAPLHPTERGQPRPPRPDAASANLRLLAAQDRPDKSCRREFALLIPDVTDRRAADWTLDSALRLVKRSARGKVEGLIGVSDPFESVQDAVRQGNFDEIIISTLPQEDIDMAAPRPDPPGRAPRAARDCDRPRNAQADQGGDR
jgi:hypothetical protein